MRSAPDQPSDPMADIQAILVGFNYAASDPRGFGLDASASLTLEGMVNDVVAGWRWLRSIGVHAGNVRIVTDEPADAVRARLAPGEAADGAPQVTTLGPDGSWDDLKAALGIDAGQPAGADRGRRDQLLLMWSGHGRAAHDDPGVPPALYLPSGAVVSVYALVAALKDGRAVSHADWQPGEPPWLVAFFGACHTGVTALSGGPAELEPLRAPGDDTPRSFGGLGAVALAASPRETEANEVSIAGEWRGAMSWAITTVLSRYRTGADGEVQLTWAELIHRVRSLLSAIDVADEPRLFTPLDEANRAILRGWALRDGRNRSRPGNPIEIYPTNPFRVRVYPIGTSSRLAVIGPMTDGKQTRTMDPSWVAAGYVPNSYAFFQQPLDSSFWVNPSQANPAEYSLTAKRNGQGPDLSNTVKYPRPVWKPMATPGPVTYHYTISNGTQGIYMEPSGSTLTFYATVGSNSPGDFGASAKLSFTYYSSERTLSDAGWIAEV